MTTFSNFNKSVPDTISFDVNDCVQVLLML